MIPDLKELVPSLYSKRKEREKEDFSDMDDDLDDDLDEETMEREIKAIEARLEKTTNEDEDSPPQRT